MAGLTRLEIVKACATCGEEFHPWTTLGKFCSRGCAARRPEGRASLVCTGCGRTFERHAHHKRRGQKFCSRACANRDAESRRNRRDAMANRSGENNPNFKHGRDAGRRDREGELRFQSGQLFCQHPACHDEGFVLNQHHVVYEQHVKAKGGDRWDPRNALALCHGCHTSHHRKGSRVVPVSALREENLAFAFELLGDAAYDYFRRYYNDDFPERLARYYPTEQAA